MSDDLDQEAARRKSEVIQKLRNALKKNQLVIVVGAGVTMAATADATGKPLPRLSWTGLIRNGLDYLVAEGYEAASSRRVRQAYESLNEQDTHSLLDAANIMTDLMRRHKRLPTWLESVFGSLAQEVRHPQILEALHNLQPQGATLLTTNYDDLLERTCRLRHIGRANRDDLLRFRRGDLLGVLHVHGSYHDAGEVVLDSTDYYQVQHSDEIQNLLRTYLDFQTVVFVGCGSGLEDPNFGALLQWAVHRQENLPNRHCLLIRDGDSLNHPLLLRLRYGPGYGHLAPFLEQLLEPFSQPNQPRDVANKLVGAGGAFDMNEQIQRPLVHPTETHDLAGLAIPPANSQLVFSGRQIQAEDYTVGWICAIVTEYIAACQFLDEEHPAPGIVPSHDNNAYTYGRIGSLNVVIACLPHGKYGIVSAASVAQDMLRSFTSIRFSLLVGIAGGAPSKKHDIRLGDIVVSSPKRRSGGVINYRFGRSVQNKPFERTGSLNAPPTALLTAQTKLRARHEAHEHRIADNVAELVGENPRLSRFKRPSEAEDRLYEATYVHQDHEQSCDISCGSSSPPLIKRPRRVEGSQNPVVHYGLIASTDQLMKDAVLRDMIAEEEDVLCFEMEAAGLMDNFPCLVIRGICDYADTHKNDIWQGYAAMTATAYAKQLLSLIPAHTHGHKVANPPKSPNVLTRVPSTNTNLQEIDSDLKQNGPLVLYEAEAPVEVDIVLVHGVGGHRVQSWTSTADQKLLWPKEILPEFVPKARIISWGYEASLDQFWEGDYQGVLAHATTLIMDLMFLRREASGERLEGKKHERPIIFVGHGLGGLIIKQAFVQSFQHDMMKNLGISTKGIVFLGTPHRIQSIPQWIAVMTKLRQVGNEKISPQDEEDMESARKGLSLLTTIQQNFTQRCQQVHIFSAAEELRTANIGIVVDSEASQLATANETFFFMRSTHLELSKFSSKNSVSWHRFLSSIQTLSDEAVRQRHRLVPSAPQQQSNRNLNEAHDIPEHQASEQNDQHLRIEIATNRKSVPGAGIRLLSLDGGGVRGLSSLLILRRLMYLIRPAENNYALPRPHEIFDLIGGTSTGGLIAIMLGRLHMDVQTCIDKYCQLSEVIFQPRFVTGFFQWLWRLSGRVRVQPVFNTSILEEELKKVIRQTEATGNSEVPLFEHNPRCKVEVFLRKRLHLMLTSSLRFVCVTQETDTAHTLLRSYQSPVEEVTHYPIWMAGRATAAAPTFFAPVQVQSVPEIFIDGGLRYNNPVRQLYNEAFQLFPRLDQQLRCLLSIGTGVPSTVGVGENLKDLFSTLQSIATETENSHRDFEREHSHTSIGKKYFRFNVDRGMENIGLEEYAAIGPIQSVTRSYLNSVQRRLDKCADALR